MHPDTPPGPSSLTLSQWKSALLRTQRQIGADNLSVVAAGVAFYFLLAIAPALLAGVSLWGLVADPAAVSDLVTSVGTAVPAEVLEILQSQLTDIVSTATSALTGAGLVGVLFALWSANAGMKALFTGLNIVYDEAEDRGFLRLNAISLATTLGGIVLALVAVALVAGLPAILDAIPLGRGSEIAATVVRWPLLAVLGVAFVSLAYRFGPSHTSRRWKWLTPGAIVAVTLWLVASGGFSLYVRYFGSYGETYGSLGGVVVMMMWLWITSLLILVGAELNQALERQTGSDTRVESGRTGSPRAIDTASSQPGTARVGGSW